MSIQDRIPEYLRSNGPSVPLHAAHSLTRLLESEIEFMDANTVNQTRDGMTLVTTMIGDLIAYAQEQITPGDDPSMPEVAEQVMRELRGHYE